MDLSLTEDRFKALIRPCAELASRLLRTEGNFSPFGYARLQCGSFRGYLADDGDFGALRITLVDGLSRAEFELVVYVDNVSFTDIDGHVFNAIAYYLGGSDGLNRRILVPYALESSELLFHRSLVNDLAPQPWTAGEPANSAQ